MACAASTRARTSRLGAASGVLHTVLELIEQGATHVGVATDHVIESFRNPLWPGYKTGDGIEPALWAQFHPLERALVAMGIATWPMVELEADDALASAAHLAAVDLASRRFVSGRRTGISPNASKRIGSCRWIAKARRSAMPQGVQEKFGVPPALIPDFLALVGDTADGYPGLEGIGKVGAARLVKQIWADREVPRRSAQRGTIGHGTAVQETRDACGPTHRCSAHVDALRMARPNAEFCGVRRAVRRCAPARSAAGKQQRRSPLDYRFARYCRASLTAILGESGAASSSSSA